ncbi:MAG: S-layer homology domain-containing protein [Candidatus Limnocylindria bacterium]
MAAILILALPAIALASHQFSDVPTSSPFHTNISHLVESGITAGCGSGKYCPKSEVNREQMAAFLTRGLGRTALDSNEINFNQASSVYLASVRVSTGGATGGAGFVKLSANVSAVTEEPGLCPCHAFAYIQEISTGAVTSDSVVPMVDNGDGFVSGNGGIEWVFRAPSNVNRTYALAVDLVTAGTPVSSDGDLIGMLTAEYIPFGSTGGDTLGLTQVEPQTIGEPRPNKRQAP